ncbi:MAG: RICIN domain-containing protein [Pseudomonadales bacterium]|nr:RICIN domain-containing protein [Pseudomonadales bacterium]
MHLWIKTLIVPIFCLTFMIGCKQQVTDLEGEFTISSRHTDMLLGVSLSAEGDNVFENVQTEPVLPNTIWILSPLEDRHYNIISKHSGLALTAETRSSESDTSIRQAALTGSDAQRFRIVWSYPRSDNKFFIVNKSNEQALTVKGGSKEPGANIVLQDLTMLENQSWRINTYNESLPVRELVTDADAWDVFEEAGQPYVGPAYRQDFTQHNIQPASNVDPRSVLPGTAIPGRVIVDGKPFVEYYPGTLPFIAVCIHNKTSVTQQMRDNYPVGWRSCSGDCDSLQTAIDFRDGKKSVAVGDSGSGELCKRTVQYLEKITGQRPHMIVPNWPKGLLDMNRIPRDTVIQALPPLRQHPDLIATWDDFLSFVREARDIAFQEWGGGLQIGFHGQVSRSARNHIGTGISANTVNVSEAVLNNSSSREYQKVMDSSRMKFSLLQRHLSPWDAYKGQYSLGQGIAVRGIPTFPSATMKNQQGPFFSTGGSFERNSVSRNLQDKKILGRPYPDHHPDFFDSVQLESYSNFMRGDRLNAYAAQLGEAIYGNLVYNLGFDIPRIRNGDGAMTSEELSPITTVASDCEGDPIESTIKGRVGDHFHLPQACLQYCRETPGCKFVSMFVDPSSDPNNISFKKTRMCHAYASCETEQRSDYNVYQLK